MADKRIFRRNGMRRTGPTGPSLERHEQDWTELSRMEEAFEVQLPSRELRDALAAKLARIGFVSIASSDGLRLSVFP